MLEVVSCLDHVGFVAFAQSAVDMDSAAEAAGFGGRRWNFPSRIVARELGLVMGADVVPTTIFRAEGTSTAGAPIAVEVFLPQAIDLRVARRWIERGCAVHVAFAISDSCHFRDVVGIMAEECFRPPTFAHGEPLMNDVENVTALYFDGRVSGQALRIEFCHFG
jgi:hypothetical protein